MKSKTIDKMCGLGPTALKIIKENGQQPAHVICLGCEEARKAAAEALAEGGRGDSTSGGGYGCGNTGPQNAVQGSPTRSVEEGMQEADRPMTSIYYKGWYISGYFVATRHGVTIRANSKTLLYEMIDRRQN